MNLILINEHLIYSIGRGDWGGVRKSNKLAQVVYSAISSSNASTSLKLRFTFIII